MHDEVGTLRMLFVGGNEERLQIGILLLHPGELMGVENAYGLGDDPAAVILERGRVALSSGPTFGTAGAGFARLNFATSPAILREIVQRVAAVVQ